MKEVELYGNPDIEKQALGYITWLDTLPTTMSSMLKDNPREAVKTLKQVELLEVGAKKTRMDTIVKHAAITKLKVIREIGLYLKKEISVQGLNKNKLVPSLGLTYHESANFQNIAEIEDYHWAYVLQTYTNLPQALREYTRAKSIKEILEINKVKDLKSKLKSCLLNGTSAVMAELEIKNAGTKFHDDIDADGDTEWSGDGAEPVVAVPVKQTALEKQTNDFTLFDSNVVELVKYLDSFNAILKKMKNLSKDQYKGLIESVKTLKESTDRIITTTKEAKARTV